MSRYIGPIYKKSRRLGFSLLENNKEFSVNKKRTYAPGQHGQKVKKLSGYGEQLQEKQKMMYMYGLNDRQFRRLFKLAQSRKGPLTHNLFIVLESRLDNMVYRMGFAPTRRSARQLINHGHILLNGKKCTIPSIIINIDDVVSVKEKSKKLPIINQAEQKNILTFVSTDFKELKSTYIRYPERDELAQNINETYVVEWYKRLV